MNHEIDLKKINNLSKSASDTLKVFDIFLNRESVNMSDKHNFLMDFLNQLHMEVSQLIIETDKLRLKD